MNRLSTLTFSSLALVGLLAGSALGVGPETGKNNPAKTNPNKTTSGKSNPSTGKNVGKVSPRTNVTPANIETDTVHFNKLFKSIDSNANGLISVEEWNKVNEHLGTSAAAWYDGLTNQSSPRFNSMVRRFDANTDGQLDQNERESAVREWQTNMVRMIAVFDKNQDGIFSAEERTAFVAKGNKNGRNVKHASITPGTNNKTQANKGQNSETTRPSSPYTKPGNRQANVDNSKE